MIDEVKKLVRYIQYNVNGLMEVLFHIFFFICVK